MDWRVSKRQCEETRVEAALMRIGMFLMDVIRRHLWSFASSYGFDKKKKIYRGVLCR
jgi:hypothetical protein